MPQSSKFTPDPEPVSSKFIPDESPIQQSVQSEPEQSMLSRGYHLLTDPLTDAPTRAAKWINERNAEVTPDVGMQGDNSWSDTFKKLKAQMGGGNEGSLQAVGDLASGLSSPGNIALTLATGGQNIAEKAGYDTLVKALGYGAKAIAAPGVVHGASELLDPRGGWNLKKRGQGLLEIAGNVAGAHYKPGVHPTEAISEGIIPDEIPYNAGHPAVPEKVNPAIGEPLYNPRDPNLGGKVQIRPEQLDTSGQVIERPINDDAFDIGNMENTEGYFEPFRDDSDLHPSEPLPESPVTAEYGYEEHPDWVEPGQSGTKYTLRGGESDGSSVSAETLQEMGIPIPERPTNPVGKPYETPLSEMSRSDFLPPESVPEGVPEGVDPLTGEILNEPTRAREFNMSRDFGNQVLSQPDLPPEFSSTDVMGQPTQVMPHAPNEQFSYDWGREKFNMGRDNPDLNESIDPELADHNARVNAQETASNIARTPERTGVMSRSDLHKMTENTLGPADPALVTEMKANGITEPINLKLKRNSADNGSSVDIYGDNYGTSGEFTLDDAGHRTLAAAREAGITDIPVQVVGKIRDSIHPDAVSPYTRMYDETGQLRNNEGPMELHGGEIPSDIAHDTGPSLGNSPKGQRIIIRKEHLTPDLNKTAVENGFEWKGTNKDGNHIFVKTGGPKQAPILESEVGEARPTRSGVRKQLGPQTDVSTGNKAADIYNASRALMASGDMSGPLRQGLGLIHKKAFWTSIKPMFEAWRSEVGFEASQKAISERPLFRERAGPDGTTLPSFADDAGIKLTDLTDVTKREESFVSQIAEKVPGVRRSERAYTAFLNNLRADVFESLVKDGKVFGADAKVNLPLARELANFTNIASGRGSLGALEPAAKALGMTLFAPRLIAARLQMLNPHYYIMATPQVRKEALKSLFAIGAAGNLVTGLGQLAGGEVSHDPSSSDFGKLKVGNTRLDPYGGFQQYIVAGNRLFNPLGPATGFAGETPLTRGQMVTSSTSGNESNLWEPQPGPYDSNWGSVAARFGRGKLHPVVGFAVSLMNGKKEMSGKTMNLTTLNPMENAITQRLIPILFQDLYQLSQDPDMPPGLKAVAGTGAFFGMGQQTYGGPSDDEFMPSQ